MGKYHMGEQFEDYLLTKNDFESMAIREQEYERQSRAELDAEDAMEDARGNDGVPGPRDYPDREDPEARYYD